MSVEPPITRTRATAPLQPAQDLLRQLVDEQAATNRLLREASLRWPLRPSRIMWLGLVAGIGIWGSGVIWFLAIRLLSFVLTTL